MALGLHVTALNFSALTTEFAQLLDRNTAYRQRDSDKTVVIVRGSHKE